MIDEKSTGVNLFNSERPSSRLPGFYKLDIDRRVETLAELAGLSNAEKQTLLEGTLSLEQADLMIENLVAIFGVPMGIACNIKINSKDYLVPMVVEETSVVAAVSSVAKLVREYGTIEAKANEPVMIGQIQITSIPNVDQAVTEIEDHKEFLLHIANQQDPTLVRLGGGARDLIIRRVQTRRETILVIHILVDVRDAMGANAVNTMAEAIGPILAGLANGQLVCQIITNYSDQRMVKARMTIQPDCLARSGYTGREVAERIVLAYEFAEADPYRAATHNKGVMNGIDAVLLATGNDWRAVEAGTHCHAVRTGVYRPVTNYYFDAEGLLVGELEIPLAIGTIGGVTRLHPGVKIALKILNVASTKELTEVIAGVGLLQNFCALRSLVSEGIQKGHMALHAKNLALLAGASSNLAHKIAEHMIREEKISYQRAQDLLTYYTSEIDR